jgi:DNA-binding transcriptional regulator YhcF (GntR family)
MEEERLDMIQILLTKLFLQEEIYQKAGISSISNCKAAIQGISKEEEIKVFVNKMKEKRVEEDDLSFNRMTTNYEQVVDRFNEYCEKNTSFIDFDLDSARTIFYQLEGDINEQDKATLQELSDILRRCWEGKEGDIESFREMIKLQKARKLFSNALNQYKRNGVFLMKKEGCKMVLNLINILMQQIEKDDDIGSAINMLLMMQLLYVETGVLEGGKQRAFIEQKSKENSFWKNKVLWGRAIEAAVTDEAEAKGEEKKIKEIFEAQKKYEVLIKLKGFIEVMLHLDISKENVQEVILHYASKCMLPEDYLNQLKVTFL